MIIRVDKKNFVSLRLCVLKKIYDYSCVFVIIRVEKINYPRIFIAFSSKSLPD